MLPVSEELATCTICEKACSAAIAMLGVSITPPYFNHFSSRQSRSTSAGGYQKGLIRFQDERDNVEVYIYK